ncbi:thioesterase family protein [Paenactinomyces guangxiensis]|uniref:Thioesterase n=1 Tax=Paenactinomyces guangxiensis TaxID=1490290 RepID=A0A7W2A7S2_9BACL|nr:thioesterase [Paenactinomyces guangxiensis]MBA4493412.1 thioesterase [Paenactinomyces guangxiensis]MBH8590503.1 thioesterase [Paenactinomyces guangxiensis]
MKPGLVPGYEEKMVITVTDEMAASFGGEMVHPALSTVTMVYYMEWVGRKVILPFLEAGEEGVGASINVRHRAPAPLGKQVTFVARVTQSTPNKVVCTVLAEHNRAIVGEGEFTQIILPKERIRENIERMK